MRAVQKDNKERHAADPRLRPESSHLLAAMVGFLSLSFFIKWVLVEPWQGLALISPDLWVGGGTPSPHSLLSQRLVCLFVGRLNTLLPTREHFLPLRLVPPACLCCHLQSPPVPCGPEGKARTATVSRAGTSDRLGAQFPSCGPSWRPPPGGQSPSLEGATSLLSGHVAHSGPASPATPA